MRRIKNAYISVMFKELFNVIENSNFVSYNSLRLALRRKNIKINISICRKSFSVFLRNEGVETELVDLLQGRISKSVFVRYYYRPDSSRFDVIREKLTKLHELLL